MPCAAKHDVKRSSSPVAQMGRAYRGNRVGDWRCRQPVAKQSTDNAAKRRVQPAASLGRRFSGHNHDQSVAVACRRCDSIDRAGMGIRQSQSVEIDDAVRCDGAVLQPTVPTGVQGIGPRLLRPHRWFRSSWLCCRGQRFRYGEWSFATPIRSDAVPQRAFVSAEFARHRSEATYRSAAGSAPAPAPTCLPQSAGHRRPPPNRCRSGWRP